MKKFLSALLTGFALFFSIPTVLILASWNAIPGDTLYSVKSSLEDVALALTANTSIATAFSVNFTDRRYTEAVKLLDRKGSTVGYELLVAEAQQTQNMVINKQDVKNGAQLIRKIEEYQAEIEKKQVEVQSLVTTPSTVHQAPSPTPFVDPYPTTPTPTSGEKETVIIVKPVEVVIEEEEPEEVISNLEDIIEELEDIKEEIEEELPDSALDAEISTLEDIEAEEEASSRDKKDKDKDRPLKK
jgi:hypothetical protein